MNVTFADALNSRSDQLLNQFHFYNGKVAVRSDISAKRMETTIKPFRFDDADPVTVLSFLEQFKEDRDSKEASEAVAMWHLPLLRAKSAAASLAICLTARKDDDVRTLVHREIEAQECICTYIEKSIIS